MIAKGYTEKSQERCCFSIWLQKQKNYDSVWKDKN